MAEIHPGAVVSSKAKIAENVKIGPFAVVYDDVEIDEGTTIGPNAVIYDGARIGKNVRIFQGASVSNEPQDLKFSNEKTYFYIGDNTTIREFVTLHRGTVETGFSKIGSNCLVMAYAHVAHDCIIGNEVILANGVQIAGHVEIDDFTIIGGMSPVHQFTKVGKYVMVGGAFRVVQDVPPYALVGGYPLKFEGLNVIGLRRRGFSNQEIKELKEAYKILFYSGLTIEKGAEKLSETFPDNKNVKEILSFLKRSNRGIVKR